MTRLGTKEILDQSRSALRQWEPRWRANAKENGMVARARGLTHETFLMEGMGRRTVICANGPSLEESLPLIAEYAGVVDAMCCDKAFGHFIKAGIVPKFCFVADAVISWEKYGQPFAAVSKDTVLIANVTANPKWAQNWEGPICFYTNRDNNGTEKIFGEISGVRQCIPASSNVGNTAIVFPTQIMGYDRYLLAGYDMSWKPYGKYYAFDEQGGIGGKRGFMNHRILNDSRGNIVYSSMNLIFSAKWLGSWIQELAMINIDIRNCTPGSIVPGPEWDLRRQLELAADAGPKGVRKWTVAEKQKYLELKAAKAKIENPNPEQLASILRSNDIKTVQVDLKGFPVGAILRAQNS